MANLEKKDLQELFHDVRVSYRLLFEYQTRILNLMRFIGDYFSYSYKGGHPLFSSPPLKNGRGALDRWAWDWLNMYNYAFYFGRKNLNGVDINFSVDLYSDTGAFDRNINRLEKLKVDTFDSVENSKTKLILIAWKEGDFVSELLKNFNRHRTEFIAENKLHVAKAYDLVDFIDQDEIEKQLEDFNNFCRNHGLKIKTPPYQAEPNS